MENAWLLAGVLASLVGGGLLCLRASRRHSGALAGELSGAGWAALVGVVAALVGAGLILLDG